MGYGKITRYMTLNLDDPKILSGKKLALEHTEALKKEVAKLPKVPKIVSILIGDDPASILYTNIKAKKAAEVGINFEPKIFEAAPQGWTAILEEIKQLSLDPRVTGIMVQLPLPKEFLQDHSELEFLNNIEPLKDVDGLTGKGSVLPATVKGILSLLKSRDIGVRNKTVVVVGTSEEVGKPAAKIMEEMGAKVLVCDHKTENLKEETLKADILISATGVPHLIKEDYVKEGVVVIDVGAEKVDGKLMGDVDFEEVFLKASLITPVPGGVGPMTVVSLLENVVELAKKEGK